jgi:hypothetical protein
MERAAFMTLLQERIETASERLRLAEMGAVQPAA